mgnify:CR=1 FL=1
MNEKQLRMLLNGLMSKFNDIKGMDNNNIWKIYLDETQSTNDLSIGENYIIMNSIGKYVNKSFSINFNNNHGDNSYLESVVYFQTSGGNDPITITHSCGNGLTNILTEDNFNWTFSGYKYHILTFKKIGDLLFLTYNSYPIPPA